MISGSILETSATLKSLRLNMRNERGGKKGGTESNKETFTPFLCVYASLCVYVCVLEIFFLLLILLC